MEFSIGYLSVSVPNLFLHLFSLLDFLRSLAISLLSLLHLSDLLDAADEEIRCITNYKHIFHKTCVDRWIDHDQKTCPLCKTHFIPCGKMEDYNQRLCTACQSECEEYDEDVALFAQHDDDHLIASL
ncbi:unnamed protein product [Vicia faba]|uniref:RING-type domain-containing protein n=1 Tax=Vicia faba TaxID=3906 RepID=A0AAV1AV39_VICFA|nr:unnamed protein product [Vicia faba]